MARDDADSLRVRVRELEQSLALAQRGADMLAHDLRAPLRSMLGFTEALLEDLADGRTEELVSHARRVERAGQHMRAMLEALLQFARLEHAARRTGTVDLGPVVSAAVADHARAVEVSGARVRVGTMPAVRGRAADLRSLFHNLIGNALKFRHEERRPEIVVEASVRADVVDVRVSDNGRGLAAGELQTALEPFHQLRGSDREAGVGLGLALCVDILESHGGSLRSEPCADGGTCFSFTLPRADSRVAAAEAPTGSERTGAGR